MKIVVIGGYARSLTNFRGPLLSALAGAGHEVIACAAEDDRDVAAELAGLGVSYFPLPLERTGMNPVKDMISCLHMTRLLRYWQPDLVLGYTVKPVIFGSLAARIAGVPAVYSMITGLGYAFLGKGIKGALVRQLVKGLYRVALKVNRSVFFQNPDDRDLFVSSGIVADAKTCLINGSGVDVDHYRSVAPGTAPVFLMIARLLKDKGVNEYIDAARLLKRRFPEAVFRLLGPLDSNPAAITQTELDTWQREGIIEYLGVTDDIRPYMSNATVYVLPSYREGTPRTVLEAMAMGRPVVTTDVPGCRETVIKGDNGFLVPAKNPDALAAAMEKFILQPELIGTMGKRSRDIAVDKYDVRKVNAAIMRQMGLQNETHI